MKTKLTFSLIHPVAVALALVLTAVPVERAFGQTTNAPAAASGLIRYESVPGASSCKVEGTSTMHDWSMETVQLVGHLEVDAGFPASALGDASKTKPDGRIKVWLRTLKSDKEAMDKRMQDHMNVAKFPAIEFKLLELKPKSAAGATGALQFDATGTLTIYGVTRTNTMAVAVEKKENQLVVTGATPLKMSDYGIPKLTFLALASVGDDLKLKFTWVAAPKAKPAQ